MEIKNKRLSDDDFFRERKEILAQWRTGKDVDLDEAVEYQKKQSPSKNYALKIREMRAKGKIATASMMGVAPIERDIEFSKYQQDQGNCDLLTTVVDSLTRNHRFEESEKLTKESENVGRSLLNGLPIVHYGLAGCRKKIESLDLPVMVWAPAPDMRLSCEIALASGHTGVSFGGGLQTFFHYTKETPPEVPIRNFQYVNRLTGYYEERGVPLVNMTAGALSCITPPSAIFAAQIIEHLLAAEQGVKNVHYSWWGAQGSLSQAVASCITLEKVGNEYLKKLGYIDVNNITMGSYGANAARPLDYAAAFSIVCMGALVAALSRCDVSQVITIDEAHRIPTKENSAASLRAAKTILNLLQDQKSDYCETSKEVKAECEILEAELKAILDKVIELGNGDVAIGAVRAIEAGVLDQPFAANQRVARKIMGVRDAEGAVRYLSHGNLPFSKEILAFHQTKIAERSKKLGKQVDYDTVVSDVCAISRSCLLLDSDWQEKTLPTYDAFGLGNQ
jgi:methylaspartate mutase epsilon subunit